MHRIGLHNRVVQKSRISPIFQNALIYLGLNFTLKIPVSEITHPWIRANSKNALISKNYSDFHHFTTCSSSQHGFADPFPFGVLICFLKGVEKLKWENERSQETGENQKNLPVTNKIENMTKLEHFFPN